MIDLGLSKLALIGVVALVVIGPEKLPKVARMAGSLFGRAQRYISEVKSEVSREMELDELRKMQTEVQEAAGGIVQGVSEIEGDLKSAWNDDSVLGSEVPNPLLSTPTPDQLAVKAKEFRRKKLARTSSVPSWYKMQNGRKIHVTSAAARVAKYRPVRAGKSSPSFYS